jgi:hypothetical protein
MRWRGEVWWSQRVRETLHMQPQISLRERKKEREKERKGNRERERERL